MAKRIDVGPWINVGPGKFGKKNNHRAGKIWQKGCANLCVKKIILKEITMLKKNLTKQNVQTILAVGPRKNSKN